MRCPEPVNGTFWGAVWEDDAWRGPAGLAGSATANPASACSSSRPTGASSGRRGDPGGGSTIAGRGARHLLVDAGTGACWSWSDTGDYVGVAGNGQEWGRYPSFAGSWDNAGLNPADGSLYFVSGAKAALLRIARDGTQRQVSLGFTPDPEGCTASGILVDPSDASFWALLDNILDPGTGKSEGPACTWPRTGMCWASFRPGPRPSRSIRATGRCGGLDGASGHGLAHFAADGTELWYDSSPVAELYGASVDESDGSCWAAYGSGGVRHFAKDGTLLLQIPDPAYAVAVDQATGFCWSGLGPYVSVWDKAGNCLWQGGGFAGLAASGDRGWVRTPEGRTRVLDDMS